MVSHIHETIRSGAVDPRHPPASSIADVMARGFDDLLVKALVAAPEAKRPRASRKRFFIVEHGIHRLDRDMAAHYASCGVPAGLLDEWFAVSGLSLRKHMQAALHVNASMLSRTSPDKQLDPSVTERLFRQSDLFVRAAEVFGDEGSAWMAMPHRLLDGKSPAEFATNEYAGEKVRSILNAVEHGGVV